MFVDVSFSRFNMERNMKKQARGISRGAAPRKYYGNIKVAQTMNEEVSK